MFLCGFVGAESGYYFEGTRVILLDNVQCTGVESSLLDCDHNGFWSYNCDPIDEVGVRCQGTGNLICVQIIL